MKCYICSSSVMLNLLKIQGNLFYSITGIIFLRSRAFILGSTTYLYLNYILYFAGLRIQMRRIKLDCLPADTDVAASILCVLMSSLRNLTSQVCENREKWNAEGIYIFFLQKCSAVWTQTKGELWLLYICLLSVKRIISELLNCSRTCQQHMNTSSIECVSDAVVQDECCT